MKFKNRIPNKIFKMARKGFRGYPVATVAYYGPDNHEATKVAVGIVNSNDEEPAVLMRWWSEEEDARFDEKITKEILEFINEHGCFSCCRATIARLPSRDGNGLSRG